MNQRPLLVLHVDVDMALRAQVAGVLSDWSIKSVGLDTAADLMERIDLAQSRPADLIIVDDDLPDARCEVVCGQVRKRGSLPIIVTTYVAESARRLDALQWGADDALSKPFDPRELAARIHAVTRRSQSGEAARICIGSWILDTISRSLLDEAGGRWPLPTNEFRLLRVLAAEPGSIVHRDTISREVRGLESAPLDRYVDNLVSKLRARLRGIFLEVGTTPLRVRAFRGEGYQLEVLSRSDRER